VTGRWRRQRLVGLTRQEALADWSETAVGDWSVAGRRGTVGGDVEDQSENNWSWPLAGLVDNAVGGGTPKRPV
jgi:hypothetical protein